MTNLYQYLYDHLTGIFGGIKGFPGLFKQAFARWRDDDASLLAASLAYYGLFSLISLLILIFIFIDLLINQGVLGRGAVQQAQDLAGQHAPQAVGEIIDQAGSRAASFRFTLLSFFILLFGASGLFVQTKRAFSIIWSQENHEPLVVGTVRSYVRSFLLITFVALLLMLSAIINAILLPLSRYIEGLIPTHLGLLRLATMASSLLFVAILFAVTYKTLSEIKLSWKDVLLGSAVASLLFAIGNIVIEILVSIIDFGSAYGAASSLVVFLLWIYYSAQIFLFGAELIKIQKRRMPKRQTGR